MPSKNIEYAYKEELIKYIETGTFKYDEDLWKLYYYYS
jgi:hypothetical protein